VSEPIDVYAHRERRTDAQLLEAPEGLYLVVDDAGELVRRVGETPARLLARVRKHWGLSPGRVVRKVMRKDGLQIVWQWEGEEGSWPEAFDDGRPLPTAADAARDLEEAARRSFGSEDE
jgi:hypothetical protein